MFTILCITLFISDLHITDDLAPCSICLSSFVVMDTSSHLPCNHLFHLHCIQAWLAKVRSTVGTQNNLNLCFDKTILSWSYLENYLNTKVELFFLKNIRIFVVVLVKYCINLNNKILQVLFRNKREPNLRSLIRVGTVYAKSTTKCSFKKELNVQNQLLFLIG